jgi:hypothetical protein
MGTSLADISYPHTMLLDKTYGSLNKCHETTNAKAMHWLLNNEITSHIHGNKHVPNTSKSVLYSVKNYLGKQKRQTQSITNSRNVKKKTENTVKKKKA